MATFSNFVIFTSYNTNVSKDVMNVIDDVSNDINVIKIVINNRDCCYKMLYLIETITS